MMDSEVIQGRLITPEDIQLIVSMIEDHTDLGRTRISQELCRCWDWTDPKGRMKDMACRSLLLKLERRGLITLPARKASNANAHRGISFQPVLHSRSPIRGTLRSISPVRLAHADTGDNKLLWQTLVTLYHYKGFKTRVGKSMAYLVRDVESRPVACVLFGAAAWKTAPRDRYIGWTHEQRRRNLHKVINNMRFLIPPWVRVPHLASHVLGKVLRRVRGDWFEKYGHDICLVETFVDLSRFSGVCYRAANWTCMGQTAGRGRNDRYNTNSLPIKAVYVRALCRSFRQKLKQR